MWWWLEFHTRIATMFRHVPGWLFYKTSENNEVKMIVWIRVHVLIYRTWPRIHHNNTIHSSTCYLTFTISILHKEGLKNTTLDLELWLESWQCHVWCELWLLINWVTHEMIKSVTTVVLISLLMKQVIPISTLVPWSSTSFRVQLIMSWHSILTISLMDCAQLFTIFMKIAQILASKLIKFRSLYQQKAVSLSVILTRVLLQILMNNQNWFKYSLNSRLNV